MNLSREYAQFSNEKPASAGNATALTPAPEDENAPSEDIDLSTGQGTTKVLTALIGVLRTEAKMLADQNGQVDTSLTRQKMQLMMQLNRINPTTEQLNTATRNLLTEARGLLDTNAKILDRRMNAIREIAELISNEINEAQSDGTYNVSVASRGYSSF